MTYKKTSYSPQALKVAATQATPASQASAKTAAVKSAEPAAPAKQNVTSLSAAKAKDVNRWGTPQTSRQEIDTYLQNLTQIVEKDPRKAAEVFKSWLDKPSKIVKPKRAA